MIRFAVNLALSQYLDWRYRLIERSLSQVNYTQNLLLTKLIQTAQYTSFGKQFGFRSIRNYEDFASYVPLYEYDELKPFIKRMMLGEKDVLWNGRVKWFSKSAGTTSDKSKFIPVTKENLFGNHIKGSWDTMALLYHHVPDIGVFKNKNLIMGGSISCFEDFPDTMYGDISAIMIHHMPGIARPFYTPDLETAILPDWEQKIERTARQIIKQPMVMFGGVPTWNLVLFKKVLEITGAKHLLEIWPTLKAYVHGGVGFGPYKEQFNTLLPDPSFNYMEVYNASEGYFSVSHQPCVKDMLLLINNGTFYEFIELNNYQKGDFTTIPLEDVRSDVDYAMVVTTNAGLWRYIIGDTVRFTSLSPHRLVVTGRTKQFVNAFGEEVMVSNTDAALAKACHKHHVIVTDYTVAPIYFEMNGQGGHQWIIEFEKSPLNLSLFEKDLDDCLKEMNSDYEAKRSSNMALRQLQITDVPKGTFLRWLRSKGKVGGQNKVPRLSNNRNFIEEILAIIQKSDST
jgi:hypothetical protein